MLKALLLSYTLATRAIALAAVLNLAGMAMAQINLVQNPSFEDTVNCSIYVPGMLKAQYWYNPNMATPDIWDCDLDRECGIAMDPDHWATAQLYQPSHDGLRHAGIYTWFGPGSSNTRDYIMTRLNEPLLTGHEYTVSLWYARQRTFIYAVDHIGVWFGMDSIYEATPNWLNVTPQVKLRDPDHEYLTEDQEWTELTDTYIAQGGEQWMVIGNFDVADSVNEISLGPITAWNPWSYYFIDAIAVTTNPVHSITGDHLAATWASDGILLQWPVELGMVQIHLFDGTGRLIRSDHTVSGSTIYQFPTSSLAKGIYVVVAQGKEGTFTTRVVKGE